MLSLTTLCVTVAEADAYCAARGMADWVGTTPAKEAALRRGQDYIAGEYNHRWMITFDDTTAPSVVKYAVIEAAIREIKVPFSLTPDLVMGREKVLTEVKGIKWTPAVTGGKAADFRPKITSIEQLLRGVALVTTVYSHFTV